MNIGVDVDGVFAELKRLLRELQEFPSPAEVAVVEGDVSQTTREFHLEVSKAAYYMGAVTELTLQKLQSTHDTIRAAALQIAERDAALADEVQLIVSLLDSAVEQAAVPTATGATGATVDSSGAAANGVRAAAENSADQPEGVDY